MRYYADECFNYIYLKKQLHRWSYIFYNIHTLTPLDGRLYDE